MDASSYMKELSSKGLGYLKDLSLKHLVALDIETTGFSPTQAQVTQVGMMAVGHNRPRMSTKCRLTEETLQKLRVESSSKVLSCLKRGSTHWVLRYNNYHPMFRRYGELLLGGPCAHKLAVMTPKGLQFAEQGSEIPLLPNDMRLLSDGLLNLPEEKNLLTGLFSQLQTMPPGTGILGQNIILFDIPFLEGRAGHYGMNSWFHPRVVDTMWISRVLLIPALEILAPDDAKSSSILRKLTLASGKVSSSLQDLVVALVATGGTAHDALGDCQTTVSVLKKMQEYAVYADGVLSANPALYAAWKTRVDKEALKEPKY